MNKDKQWLLEEKYAGQKSPEYETDLERLASGEPLAYIIGYQPFLGLKIYLDEKPLIPRSETEWWTGELVALIKHESSRDQFQFLDLCAGSGAVGCAILKNFLDAQIYFGEINPTYEATIVKNMRKNNLAASRAEVRIGDLFEPFGDMRFDVIAANPPYIPTGRALPASVANHEPSLALLAGEDGLGVMRRIAKALSGHLTRHGFAWIECDSEHAGEARKLFLEEGFLAKIRNDQYGAPRVIVVSFL